MVLFSGLSSLLDTFVGAVKVCFLTGCVAPWYSGCITVFRCALFWHLLAVRNQLLKVLIHLTHSECFFPFLVIGHFCVTLMSEFIGTCIWFPFQGMPLFSDFPLSVCHILLSFYFLSGRGISLPLYLFLPLMLILFVSLQDPSLYVRLAPPRLSLPLYSFIPVTLLQPSVPVLPAFRPWHAASLSQWSLAAFVQQAHPASSHFRGPQ